MMRDASFDHHHASIDGESTVEHELTLPRVDEFDSAEDLAHCTLWGKNGPERLKSENRENTEFWQF